MLEKEGVMPIGQGVHFINVITSWSISVDYVNTVFPSAAHLKLSIQRYAYRWHMYLHYVCSSAFFALYYSLAKLADKILAVNSVFGLTVGSKF